MSSPQKFERIMAQGPMMEQKLLCIRHGGFAATRRILQANPANAGNIFHGSLYSPGDQVLNEDTSLRGA